MCTLLTFIEIDLSVNRVILSMIYVKSFKTDNTFFIVHSK